jgi:alpha-tubulin suppressor-like RCC1 family protein
MIAIGRQSCALVADGVKCWDNSVSAPIVEIEGLTSGVTRIAAGGSHNCAVVSDGLRCWGDNTYGQLGGTGDGVNPVVVFGLGSQVTDVALGTIHSCALVAQGVQCWGANQYGQLGNDTQVNSSVPVPVYGLESNVVAIASGSYHTCALTAAGEVLCWGANDGGQLGNPYVGFSLVPEVVRLP